MILRRSFLASILALAVAPQLCAASPTLDDFLCALRKVETGGQPNGGRDALGDGGRSLGPLQIGRAYHADARITGQYDQVRDYAYACRVAVSYWRRYCPAALAAGDWETLARTHNGGPCGPSKQATVGYWRKVRAAMGV